MCGFGNEKSLMLDEYIDILSPFKQEVTINLVKGRKPEVLAKKYAKKNGMSLRVARAHVSRAVIGLKSLAGNDKEFFDDLLPFEVLDVEKFKKNIGFVTK